MPQFKEAFARITQAGTGPGQPAAPAPAPATPAPGSDVRGLPLVEVPAAGAPSDTLAVIVSGDGGWAGIDREIGTVIAGRGIPVVGLNSLQYFWKKKTPDIAAADLERVLRHYLAAWQKERVLLVGYSRGAEVLPFMVDRLPADLRVTGAPGRAARRHRTRRVRVPRRGLAGRLRGKDELPVGPEVEKLAGVKILCVYGARRRDSLCPSWRGPGYSPCAEGRPPLRRRLPDIAEAILREAGLGAR